MNTAEEQMAHDEQHLMGDTERAQMRRPHIFAVNGASDFLNLVREVFEREDFNITTTNFVPETFDQIAALQPSVLLVDLVHGQRAGFELLERLHAGARTHGIPVLVLSTGQANLEDVQANPIRYGGDAFLGKPFDLDTLLQTVEALLTPTLSRAHE